MAGERPAPQGQEYRSEIIVVPNPEFEDPIAKGLLAKAQRLGFPVSGVTVGKRTEVTHTAGTLKDAVVTAATMAETLLANPTSERIESVKTSITRNGNR